MGEIFPKFLIRKILINQNFKYINFLLNSLQKINERSKPIYNLLSNLWLIPK